jgi:aminoglycoside N3'-acetyltransferase
MSKLAKIRNLIDGTHVMGNDPLRDYHAASKVRDASRIRDVVRRFMTIKSTLHPYRVTVSWSAQGEDVTIRRNDTQQTIVM